MDGVAMVQNIDQPRVEELLRQNTEKSNNKEIVQDNNNLINGKEDLEFTKKEQEKRFLNIRANFEYTGIKTFEWGKNIENENNENNKYSSLFQPHPLLKFPIIGRVIYIYIYIGIKESEREQIERGDINETTTGSIKESLRKLHKISPFRNVGKDTESSVNMLTNASNSSNHTKGNIEGAFNSPENIQEIPGNIEDRSSNTSSTRKRFSLEPTPEIPSEKSSGEKDYDNIYIYNSKKNNEREFELVKETGEYVETSFDELRTEYFLLSNGEDRGSDLGGTNVILGVDEELDIINQKMKDISDRVKDSDSTPITGIQKGSPIEDISSREIDENITLRYIHSKGNPFLASKNLWKEEDIDNKYVHYNIYIYIYYIELEFQNP